MQVSIKISGLEMAQARLAEVNRKVDPVLRGALNTTANKARTVRYVNPLRGSLMPVFSRRALRVKRARGTLTNARIIPSSSGVPVTRYLGWGYSKISATRARIWVKGPNGHKVAAGFVNPSSFSRMPWSTRIKVRGAPKGFLSPALGPSVAYWFKQLTDNQTIRWTNIFLQQEFEKRIRQEVAKGAR